MTSLTIILTILKVTRSLRLNQPIEVGFENEFQMQPNKVSFDDSALSFGLGCPNPQHPKLAICMAGMSHNGYNNFVSEGVTSRFVQLVLNASKAAGAEGLTRAEPDVFIHAKLGKNSMESAVDAANKVHATQYVWQEGKGDASISELGNPQCFSCKHGGPLPLISYYKSIHGCLQLVKEAEKKSRAKYDVVIFSRPDHEWAEPGEKQKITREYTHKGKHGSFGGAPVQARIQCSKSMFAADLYSFQKRADFEHYGNIYMDQITNPNPSKCRIGLYEDLARNAVEEINRKTPGSAVYSDHFIDASQSGIH